MAHGFRPIVPIVRHHLAAQQYNKLQLCAERQIAHGESTLPPPEVRKHRNVYFFAYEMRIRFLSVILKPCMRAQRSASVGLLRPQVCRRGKRNARERNIRRMDEDVARWDRRWRTDRKAAWASGVYGLGFRVQGNYGLCHRRGTARDCAMPASR